MTNKDASSLLLGELIPKQILWIRCGMNNVINGVAFIALVPNFIRMTFFHNPSSAILHRMRPLCLVAHTLYFRSKVAVIETTKEL